MYNTNLFIESNNLKRLTETELVEYFEKYKQGDKQARKIIIEHGVRIVIERVSKKFYNSPYDKKELVSVGIFGLIKSIDTFDISKNFRFSAYATKCIDNEINMFIRKEKKYRNNSSLDSNDYKIKSEDTWVDNNSDFISEYLTKELYGIINKIVENLPERDRKIVLLRFGFIDDIPLTQKQIASRLNISQSNVSRLLQTVLEEIRLKLQEEGIIQTSFVHKKNKQMKFYRN